MRLNDLQTCFPSVNQSTYQLISVSLQRVHATFILRIPPCHSNTMRVRVIFFLPHFFIAAG